MFGSTLTKIDFEWFHSIKLKACPVCEMYHCPTFVVTSNHAIFFQIIINVDMSVSVFMSLIHRLKVKWFMFGLVHAKLSWTIYLSVKINYRINGPISSFKLESIMEVQSILLESNQTCQNLFYTSRINFDSFKSETKHT